MSWVVVGIVAIAGVLGLVWFMRGPEKNVDRGAFGHWIESLMRYYEDGSRMVIVDKASRIRLCYVRSDTRGDGCRLLFSVGRTPLAIERASMLKGECEKECDAEAGSEAVVAGFVDVYNIWATGAGSRAARVAHRALDVMEIAPDTHFDLTFKGRRSVGRTAEARERLRF